MLSVRGRLLAVTVLTAAVLVAGGGAAGAHALRQSSYPDAGATLAKPPTEVRVTFGEQPDPGLSSLRVLDTSGADHTAGPASVVAGQPLTLRVALRPLANGVYTVSWRTVSRVDGHLAAGTFAFGVGVSPAGATTSATARSPGPSTVSLATRWMLYAGLMVIVGGATVALVCFTDLTASLLVLVILGSALAALGAMGLTAGELHAAGLPLSRLLDSPFSHHFLGRVIPTVAAGILSAVALLVTRPRLRRALLAGAGGLGVVAMWGDVEASHVAASSTFRLLRMGTQCLHFVAAGVWIGGLVALLVGLRRTSGDQRSTATRRFSATAVVAVAAIATSGMERAYDEVHGLHRLVDSVFGRYVVLKSVLLVVLIGLGALNRYRTVPAVGRGTLRPLRLVARAELGLAAVVLVATGFLQGLAPPASGAPARPARPVVLTAHDFGTTMRVSLTVSPGTAGFNQFELTVHDYDTGAAVDAQAVSLRFSLPARPDLGDSTLALVRTAPGRYGGQGPNLSLDGTWSVTIAVQQASGGTEIPVSLATRQPPERIEVQRNGSLPTVYTLHLADGRAIQTYVDPGRSGVHFNEVHVTVLATDGNEVAVRNVTVGAARSPSPSTTPLATRRLDPLGHFVADLVDARSGTYRFDVLVDTASGDQLRGHFTVPVR